MSVGSSEAKLKDLAREAERLRTEIQILEEQVAFQRDVSDDARLRALVSGTPLADRDAHEAAGDLKRLEGSLADARKRLGQVSGELDRMLEGLLGG